MKNTLLLWLFIIAYFNINAQDKLVDYNNQITKVKVIEINDKEIKFKKYDNLDGPTYTESRTNYATIIFENGSIEVLSKKTPYIVVKDKSNRPRYKLIEDFKKNTLELDFLSFYTNDVAVQYTKYLKNKKMAITVPIRLGWISNTFNGIYLIGQDLYYEENNNSNNYYDNRRKPHGFKMLSGVNFKFFWRDTYKLRGYAAPEFVFGYLQSKSSNSYYNSSTGNYDTYQTTIKQGTLGFMAVAGMIAYANKIINFKMEVAGGFIGFVGKRDSELGSSGYFNYYKPRVTGIGRATFALGVNF